MTKFHLVEEIIDGQDLLITLFSSLFSGYSHHMASRSSDLGYNQNLLLLQCVTMVTLYLQKSVH